MKFTDASIKALKPGKERREVFETNGRGFGLRVGTSERKSWIFLYRFAGSPRRMTLGTFPFMGLALAHEAHAKARTLLDRGIDPGTEKSETKRILRDEYTLEKLAQEFIDRWSKKMKKSWKEDDRLLAREVLPFLGKRKVSDIKRLDVIHLLDGIVDRGSPVTANRTLAVIRKMFNFGVGRSIIDATPVAAIPAPSKETPRDRVLSESEIKSFWYGLENAGMDESLKLALKLLLTLGQRKSEIINAEWSEFDLSQGWWTIPKEKSKNGLAHRVPLPSFALEILSEIKTLSGESHWLFRSPRGDHPMTGRSLNHAIKRNSQTLGSIFSVHDLRRTAATHMTGAGISRFVVGKILNHSEKGVISIYDRSSYDAEKRQALETWSRKLQSILTGERGNVIPLQAKA